MEHGHIASLERALKAREQQIRDLVTRLETAEQLNEALAATLRDREMAEGEIHESLVQQVAELTTAEEEVSELRHDRKEWSRERRQMAGELQTLRHLRLQHRSEISQARKAERRKLVSELLQGGDNGTLATACSFREAGRCPRCDGFRSEIENLLRENQRLRSSLGGLCGDGSSPRSVTVRSPRTPPRERPEPPPYSRNTSFSSFRSV